MADPSSLVEYLQAPVLVSMRDSAKNAARSMAANGSSCAIVTLDRHPIGIVTEWDLLTRIVVLGKDPASTPVSEAMSAPLWTVLPTTKIEEAISLMTEKGFRRLVVKDEQKLHGLVSLNQLEGNSREASVLVPMLESPTSRCPLCQKIFPSRSDLSIHIREELTPKE